MRKFTYNGIIIVYNLYNDNIGKIAFSYQW